jgi:hypothetical protein
MKDISKIFDKEVYLTDENYRGNYLIKVYKEDVEYNIKYTIKNNGIRGNCT